MTDDFFDGPMLPKRRGIGFGLVVGGLVLVLVGLIGVIGYFGVGPLLAKPASPPPVDTSDVQDVETIVHPSPTPVVSLQPVQLSQDQLNSLLGVLARSVQVPQEVPEVEMIEDPKPLSNQPIFAKSVKGDLLIIFHTAKIVYVLRPSTGEVVAQGTVEEKSN